MRLLPPLSQTPVGARVQLSETDGAQICCAAGDTFIGGADRASVKGMTEIGVVSFDNKRFWSVVGSVYPRSVR